MKFMEGLITGVEQALENPNTRSQELLFKILLKQFRRIQEAIEDKNKFITYFTYCGPVEIFYALDSVVPICLEPFIAFNAGFFGVDMKEYLDASAGYGIPEDICSAHRAPIGMALKGTLPPPDLYVASSHTSCSDMKSGVFLKDFYKVPAFLLDTPYLFDEEGINYYANQLRGMMAFLEEKTGEKLDAGRLKEVVTLGNEAISAYKEINQLRKKVPTPLKNIEILGPVYAMFTAFGTPEAVDYLKALRDEVKARKIEEKENYRIYFAFVLPFFYEGLPILDWMENEHGAKIAMEIFSQWPEDESLDPERPFESLAKKELYRPLIKPLLGEVERWTEDAVKYAREYKAEGAVFYTQIGCKVSNASIKAVTDALREKAGIPTLVIDGDLVDPTIISFDNIKTKLEGFFEMLDERK